MDSIKVACYPARPDFVHKDIAYFNEDRRVDIEIIATNDINKVKIKIGPHEVIVDGIDLARAINEMIGRIRASRGSR